MRGVDEVITLEAALEASRREVTSHFASHVNPPLKSLLALIGADRRYVRASGATVFDEEGREYLDFLGGYGAVNLGHNHPELLAALERVAERPNILQASINPLVSALAASLARVTPGRLAKTFLCNSGAEAVEAALKLARAATGRTDLVSCTNSFHGKTFGALSVTGRARYQDPFRPLLPGCHAVPFGDLDALAASLSARTAAAFIVEPVQGEGGIILPPDGYLAQAQQLCRDTGTLFVLDEVQTGLGRTGYLFAAERDGLEPDIIALAKSLGGGVMPIGACIATDAVWRRAYGSRERCLLHTSTFGGNTRACAVALKTLEILLRDDVAAQTRRKGEQFIARLRTLAAELPIIKEVRGRGLLIGIELQVADDAPRWAREYLGAAVCGLLLQEHGIITAFAFNNPNTIRFEPPLVVSEAQLDRAASALAEVCRRCRTPGDAAVQLGRTLLKSKVRRLFGTAP
jgi:putrescine aminotransferase